jgi:2,3-bisphosphoglycerate-dependent phosphoglycerate mutase
MERLLVPDLTARGVGEARAAGRGLKLEGYSFDAAFTSELVRAQRTCALLLEEMGLPDLAVIRDPALNERDYGDLSGLNKDEARARWGDAQVHAWRRSYDVRPPGGESLKDTAARVLPYYITTILPRVMAGQRVLVAAHGNSLRALVMVLDRLDGEAVTDLQIRTGVPLIYRLNADTTIAAKTVLACDGDARP